METNIAILYFSGYGHTKKQAEAVEQGAKSVAGAKVDSLAIDKEGNVSDVDWATLAEADAILFGCPTYMGGPAWQFKKFADMSFKAWSTQAWKDKVAGLHQFFIAQRRQVQHALTSIRLRCSTAWCGSVSVLNLPVKKASTRNDVNWLGGFSGLLAQSPVDATPEEGPSPGDLETAHIFGKRVADYTKKTRNGQAAQRLTE